MQHNVKHVASVSLILIAFTAFSASLTGIQIPPVDEYLQEFPELAAFALQHPQEVMQILNILMDDPALFEWVLQHFEELYPLFSDEVIMSLLTENDWLLPLMQDLYTLDSAYFQTLFLDQTKTLELLNWLVEHPEYQDLLRQFPELIQELIESGFEEAVLTPMMRILSPFPYQMVTGTVHVNLTVYSPHGVRDVMVRWNSSDESGVIARWQDRTGTFSTTWDTEPLTPTLYSLTAVAETGNGSQLSDTITVTVAPIAQIHVAILTPERNVTITDTLSIRALVTSTTPIDRCYFTLQGTHVIYAFDLTGPDATNLYTLDTDTGLIVDGPYTLTVVALDVRGYGNSSSRTITISDTPRVVILTPANHSVLRDIFPVTVNVSSVDPIAMVTATFSGDNGSYIFPLTESGDLYQRTVVPTLLAEGVYDLTVTVVDADNSQNTSRITVTITHLAPSLRILTPPDEAFVSGNFTIAAQAIGYNQVTECYALFTGPASQRVDLTDLDGDDVYQASVDTASLLDGDYNITVYVLDQTGSLNASSITLHIQDVPVVTILTPTSDEVVGGNFTISARVDSVDAVDRCYATLSNATFTRLSNLTLIGGVYSGALDTGGVSDGGYTLTVSAVDDDDSTANVSVTVTVTNLPTLTIDTPADGSTGYGSFTIQVSTYSYRAIATCTAVLSNATFNLSIPLVPVGGGRYAGLINSTMYSDGWYTLTATVVDALGSRNTEQLALALDNVPDVALLTPLNNVIIQDIFTINADVQSRHPIAQVVVLIDGVAFGNLTDTQGVYAVDVDSILLSEGTHTIYVVAINDQGYGNATATHTVHVDNKAEIITFVSPANQSFFTDDFSVITNIADYVDTAEWYVNNWLVATQLFSNAYTTTVTYTIDISNILFPPNIIVITVRYTSALGHTSTSENLILYKT